MKKLLIPFSILGFFTIITSNVNAETIEAPPAKATFELEKGTNGTIEVQADNLTFGKHTLTPFDIITKTTSDSSVKVIEFSGEKPGWTLSVQLDKFEDKPNNNKIDGVRLFYPIVTPTTTTGGSASTDAPVSLGTNKSFDTSVSLTGRIVNDDNVPVKLATAAKGKGYGTWTLPYNDANRIQLNVPSGQKVGSYTADLKYTVADIPTP